jgi:hypothetical protein
VHENLGNHILNIRIKYKVIWIIIISNIQTKVYNYHETLILIYFTHQCITYGITESIHIRIMSKLIIVNALVRRILWQHSHVVRCSERTDDGAPSNRVRGQGMWRRWPSALLGEDRDHRRRHRPVLMLGE